MIRMIFLRKEIFKRCNQLNGYWLRTIAKSIIILHYTQIIMYMIMEIDAL